MCLSHFSLYFTNELKNLSYSIIRFLTTVISSSVFQPIQYSQIKFVIGSKMLTREVVFWSSKQNGNHTALIQHCIMDGTKPPI